MLCVCIKGPTLTKAFQQITEALKYVDLVELRLDLFENLEITDLKKLRAAFSLPMIFTLRDRSQGGGYSGSESKRLDEIRSLADLNPEYLDLEYHVPLHFIREISTLHPEIKLIISYHNFSETPEDLNLIYKKLMQLPGAFYKIAVQAQSSIDALRILQFLKECDGNVTAIAMGPDGQLSRVLGPVFGSKITYACLSSDEETAPGQINVQTLIEKYRLRSITSNTQLLGLIGDPIENSVSDESHNFLMEKCGFDAIYVKMRISIKELPQFFDLAKILGFKGLSVTMPLKEKVIEHVDFIDSQTAEIGAINTIIFENGKLKGCNTDGFGALNSIEEAVLVKGKRIIILGAGGAAKSIAHEAIQRGAKVIILNRSEEKARLLGEKLGCLGKGLDTMEVFSVEGYDILINCTPSSMPIDAAYIIPNAIVMDIKTRPKETEFLQKSKEKGCQIIYGYKMFVEQAVGQYAFWYRDCLKEKIREILGLVVSNILK